MDIEMPQLSGIEVTTQIRGSSDNYNSVPILGYTGHSTPDLIDKIKNAGMNDYLIKPAEKSMLLNKISHWI